MDPKTYKFDTLSLHAGYQPSKNAGSRQVPIYQTTSYMFDDVDHAAALFNLERGGHIYSRMSNPTVQVLEERVCALEGGTAALATASGMSAIFLTIMTLCNAGDHMVVSSQLYGGKSTVLVRGSSSLLGTAFLETVHRLRGHKRLSDLYELKAQ